jgi:hypothetical protein
MWVTNLLKVLRKATDATLSTPVNSKIGFQYPLVSAIFRPYEKRVSCRVQPDEPQAHKQ